MTGTSPEPIDTFTSVAQSMTPLLLAVAALALGVGVMVLAFKRMWAYFKQLSDTGVRYSGEEGHHHGHYGGD